MKFVIAPDSFKQSMTAMTAATAIRDGLIKIFPDATYVLVPLADGGEGTVQSLVDATQGTFVTASVVNPLGEITQAQYGILGDGQTAIIEMAAASGIQFVDAGTKNPLITTTYGTGQLMLDALNHGVRKIIVGLGGSATNDGGAGMAQALGARLLDAFGDELAPGGGALAALHRIDVTDLDPRLADTEVVIASDVQNPLLGQNGASAVFGPQKGAAPAVVRSLEAALTNYARVVAHDLGVDLATLPGGGAAGGLGAGLVAFTGAKIVSGVEMVIQATHLKALAKDADVAFVGEGAIDFQTQYGKTPFGAAKAIKSVAPKTKVIGLAGFVGADVDALYELGFDAIFSIVPGAVSLADAMQHGPENLRRTAENIARLLG
jgi:glycerate kinase